VVRIVCAVVVAGLAFPVVAVAESPLVAAAKREQKRREDNKRNGATPALVVTQADLGARRGGAEPSRDDDDGDTRNAFLSPSYSYWDTTRSRAGDEQVWRARAQFARARVEMARETLAATPAIQTTHGCVPTVKENPAHVAAEKELNAAQQAVVDLEEEGRRAGALPGWLR
jgi:hypothetical protein